MKLRMIGTPCCHLCSYCLLLVIQLAYAWSEEPHLFRVSLSTLLRKPCKKLFYVVYRGHILISFIVMNAEKFYLCF
jgi:hypothetical protein